MAVRAKLEIGSPTEITIHLLTTRLERPRGKALLESTRQRLGLAHRFRERAGSWVREFSLPVPKPPPVWEPLCFWLGLDAFVPLLPGVALCFKRATLWANTLLVEGAEVEPRENGMCQLALDTLGILWDGSLTLCCLDFDGVLTFGCAADYDDGTPPARTLARAGFDARSSLVTAVEALVEARQNGESDQQQLAVALFDRAVEYYHVGRLAMRSQCESFMQTLASVDGQTTFGRDLANNFFDTATVAATITGSPSIWATGLSTTQNSFNSVGGSTERFLLLTESVGALRERVVSRMAASEGTPIDFYAGRTNITGATALDYTRRAIEAVQRYGTPCTEAGIRLIVTEALCLEKLLPFETELYRVPFVVLPYTYGWAVLGAFLDTLASVLLVRRRLDTLDLIPC